MTRKHLRESAMEPSTDPPQPPGDPAASAATPANPTDLGPPISAEADHPLDGQFYLDADAFFSATAPVGLTFDDVSLATRYSGILPRETSTRTRLSESLNLEIPIISADMDTVTEHEMAIGMALNGGLGIIHYNMSERDQLRQVSRVKNHIHGLIQDPIKVAPEMLIGDVLALVEERRFKFRTFPVVNEQGILLGLLSGRVVKERYASTPVGAAMTPRGEVFTIEEKAIGNNPIQVADRFFTEHMGIHKLLVVDEEDRLKGLFTLSDIERISEELATGNRAARDAKFRLICGAAVYNKRLAGGELDGDGIRGHVAALVERGVDAVAVSTAHGYSRGVGETVRLIRDAFPELTIIAGNVTSAAGVAFLLESGANTVKVGQGPGSICTTRVVAGVGIPQMTALYVASREAQKRGGTILADGGISKSGDIVKALTLADAVMCGGLLAGCRESPGQLMEIDGKLYKQYRGMGSLAAMRAGSASRYGHDKTDRNRKMAAEGIEALKEVSGNLETTLAELVGGIQSGLGYLGARNLCEHRTRARYIRVSPAGMKEATPHDVVEVKTTKADE